MGTNSKFFLDFMSPFFNGLVGIFKGIGAGLGKMFNVVNYFEIIKKYSSDLGAGGWIVVILMIIFLLFLFALLIFIIAKGIKRFIKYKRNYHRQESLIEEIDELNNDIIKLKNENEKYKTMADPESGDVEYDEEGNIINKLGEGESRFFIYYSSTI